MNRQKICVVASVVVLTSTLFSGCSANNAPGSQGTSNSNATGVVTVENCGRSITVSSTPQRILVIHPAMTEILVAVGAQEQILGQAWTVASLVTPEYQERVDAVQVISERIPDREKVTELNPDMIVASGEFWFDGERMQTIDSFMENGVPVFVSSAACGDTSQATVADSWKDIEDLGLLTGHGDEAKALVADYKSRLADAKNGVSGDMKKAALISIYEGDVFALATGLYTDVLGEAGLTNAFDGVLPEGSQFSRVSAEAVIAQNPEVLLVSVADPAKNEEMVAQVNELFANTDAVRNGKVLTIGEGPFIGGLGAPVAVERLIHELA